MASTKITVYDKGNSTKKKASEGISAGVGMGITNAQKASNVVTNSGKYGVTNNGVDTTKTYTPSNIDYNGIAIGTDTGTNVTATPTAQPTSNGSGNSYYDPSADLLAAYNARQAALKSNYNAALNQLRNSYNTSVNDLKNQGDEALREAYINMMMNKRGLNQSLEAQGLRGGATESAMANLYNTYASDRNAIARAIAQNLTDVGNKYGENVANLGMKYGENNADAVADYQKQLINARQTLANQLAKTSSNSKGTSVTNVSAEDLLGAYNNGINNATAGAATGALAGLNNLASLQQTASSVPEYSGDLSSEMQQYRIRNYTPAKIRNMSPMDAYEYVMALNTDNATKEAILQDAGFDLNQLVAMLG